ncbi:alpha/beta fold hydrolase [Candidatus Phytoplasma melaleucae]|uniref:Lysophospholipase n=1 Tax=Candidatus Phytoplasma melaleucae TaxID=2982630 RepID=A0ABT9DDX4_9MOLU|nr:alpha/beta fold hydrolase ['Melaleuca sp.' phytoplasma]MDO8168228.1 lysophospholipase ['Melaleuca sp.' phytoplasma]
MFLNNNIFYMHFRTIINPRANIIITHGLGESSLDYLHIADFYFRNNYNVILYDVRGHGKSEGKKGDIYNFHILLDDLKLIVDYVKQKYPFKVILIGHSMGGIIVNCYLTKYSNVEGAIVSSAPFKSLQNKNLRYPLYSLNFFKKKRVNFSSGKIAHFPLDDGYYPYRLEYVSYRLLRNLLILSINYLKKRFFLYKTPILFVYSITDPIVSYKDGILISNNVFSQDKTLILYKNSYHNLFHDIELQKVLQDTLTWLKHRF